MFYLGLNRYKENQRYKEFSLKKTKGEINQ